jgi:hypothetical protein
MIAVIHGPCGRGKCKRDAKRAHSCATCGRVWRTCLFHEHSVFAEVQAHVIAEHPNEYAASKRTFEMAEAAAKVERQTEASGTIETSTPLAPLK